VQDAVAVQQACFYSLLFFFDIENRSLMPAYTGSEVRKGRYLLLEPAQNASNHKNVKSYNHYRS
jgi:hypothetical protein